MLEDCFGCKLLRRTGLATLFTYTVLNSTDSSLPKPTRGLFCLVSLVTVGVFAFDLKKQYIDVPVGDNKE